MYFVKRGDTYHDVTGQSFRALLEGKLPGMPGERAAISDWANHLTTIFPEVRLKRFIEMRGADVGDAQMIPALSAFWVGLLYDPVSLDAAWDLVKGWDTETRQQARDDVPRLGLKTQVGGHSLLDIARSALALSAAGLKRRARKNAQGQDETHYLAPLSEILSTHHSRAETLLARFKGEWKGSVMPVFEACVF
jgi:glutamate--cysteine ligase